MYSSRLALGLSLHRSFTRRRSRSEDFVRSVFLQSPLNHWLPESHVDFCGTVELEYRPAILSGVSPAFRWR